MPYFASKIFRISQDFQTRKVDFQGWTQLVEGHISKTTALNGPILAALALSGRALQNGMSGSENGRRGVALNKKHRYSLNYGSICKSLPDLRPYFFTFFLKIFQNFRPKKIFFLKSRIFPKFFEKIRFFRSNFFFGFWIFWPKKNFWFLAKKFWKKIKNIIEKKKFKKSKKISKKVPQKFLEILKKISKK